ncbi:MAG: hypothetical protein J6X01_03580, partial [Bacteroidales bacterium]|nr:hypothetical protein [Bacteroidales bacterium]
YGVALTVGKGLCVLSIFVKCESKAGWLVGIDKLYLDVANCTVSGIMHCSMKFSCGNNNNISSNKQ